MASQRCPSCPRGTLQWSTPLVNNHPVDVLSCAQCGTEAAREDWPVPLTPARAGRCANCGGLRQRQRCTQCGLSEEEDLAFHLELQALISPDTSLLAAAQVAAEGGRRLAALKLATAVAQHEHQSTLGRALRVGLLAELGMHEPARLDAKDWVLGEGAQHTVAWNLYGALLEQTQRNSEAIDAMERSLELTPEQPRVRAKLAECLLELQRYGLAHEQAWLALEQGAEDTAARRACAVLGDVMLLLLHQEDYEEVAQRLGHLKAWVDASPELLASRAWLEMVQDKPRQARKSLIAARRLEPVSPLLDEVEQRLGVSGRRWWQRS